MDDEIKESLSGLLHQLELTQTAAEQEVFNVLNKQDELVNLFNESVDKLMEFDAFMEGIEFQAVKVLEEFDNCKLSNMEMNSESSLHDDTKELIASFIGKQRLLQELCTSIQNLMNLVSENSEAVHRLEDNIAANRSGINSLLYLDEQ